MNINIYLEDNLAKSLQKYTKLSGHTRNAVIREAIRDWVTRHEVKKWSNSILKFKGVPGFAPFESYRDELLPPNEDPLR
jgi:metal-responsive CopG/Arc/MetJ family transcriptional regulator